MRIPHTADWHIGQTLNGWNRDYEHRSFLSTLCDVIKAERVDMLLVAGDVFDGINPSGDARACFTPPSQGSCRPIPGCKSC